MVREEGLKMSDLWPCVSHWHADSVVVLDTIANAQHALLSEEEVLENGATSSRVRELRAGRSSARRAMMELAIAPVALMSDMHGSPVWPPRTCGSIAHSRMHIAVVMSRLGAFRSLGIDLEDERELGRAAADVVSSNEVQALISCGLASDDERAARAGFSAKEAVFKCQAPLTGVRNLSFLEVDLQPLAGNGLLAIPRESVPTDAADLIRGISVFFMILQGLTVAIASCQDSV
jgi:enterobactin synthetase component D / holo-[acyl-carrier protein] synthase